MSDFVTCLVVYLEKAWWHFMAIKTTIKFVLTHLKVAKKCKFHARTKPTWGSVFYDFIMSDCDMLIGVSGKDLATLYGLKQPPLEWSWPLSKWHFWQTSLFLWPFLATQSLTKQQFYSTRMTSVNKKRVVVLTWYKRKILHTKKVVFWSLTDDFSLIL